MANTLKFGNGEWYGKEGTILAYNDENRNYKPLPFNFERSSGATRTNKEGLIETVGANEPRIDYKDDAKGALLLEPSRTNIITQSEAFDNSYWANSGSSFVGGFASPSADSPLGAFKLVSTTNDPYIYKTGLNVTANTQTASIYVKGVGSSIGKEGRILFWYIGTAGGTTLSVPFTLTSDWQRVQGSSTPTSGGTIALRIDLPDVSVVGEEVLIYGAQLEQGSYATSYIPTSGGAVTRVYDTIPTYLDLTPLNIGNSYTLFLDADLNVNDNNKVFAGIRNSSNLTSFTIRNNVGGIRLYNHIDGGYPVSGITSSTNKFVIRVDGNSYKVFVQGSSLSGTLTTQRDLGSLHFYGQHTELKINNFTIDDTALSDAECQALVN